jgi:hypothetical protein
MRKSTLFISAVLTTFVMAMLAGVASAYQGLVANKSQENLAASTSAPTLSSSEPVAEALPVAVQPANFTPDQAAALAAQVIGRDDLYSVEVTDLNGESVYMVTFSSGDLVYVSLDGQIRSIGKVPVETVVVKSGGGGGGNGGNDNPPPAPKSNPKEHEENHEEHEEHDD